MNRLGPVFAVGLLGLVVAVLVNQLLGSAGGADGAIITRLKSIERDGLAWSIDAGEVKSETLSYQRISVVLDANATVATVTSTLDFTGALHRPNGSSTRVSSLGLERARYVLKDGDWLPERSDAPRLEAIVEALEGRRAAIEAGTPSPDGGLIYGEMRSRTLRSEAWFVRSEREDVTASEDFRLIGETRERPVDDKGTTRLSLHEDGDGGFSFPEGFL